MIACPICKKNFIDEAVDIACLDCGPELNADLLVYDLQKAVKEVDKHLTTKQVKQRLPSLVRTKEHLDAIVKMVEKE